jgi:hypothetical protein
MEKEDKNAKQTLDSTMDDIVGNNVIDFLTDVSPGIFGANYEKKIRNEFLDKGVFLSHADIEETIYKRKEQYENELGNDWMKGKYGQILAEMDFDASDDQIAEKFSMDAMELSMTKYLTDDDVKRAEITQQINEEKGKSAEEKDMNKIRTLTNQLNSLGKTYYNPLDMAIIDPEKATDQEKEFMFLQDETENKYKKLPEHEIRDAYFRSYANLQAWEREWEEWGEESYTDALNNVSRDNPSIILPERVEKLKDLMTEKKIEFMALSKLYVANNSPENVKKDAGYYINMFGKSFAQGLLPERLVNDLSGAGWQTNREYLDVVNRVIQKNDLPLSDEEKKVIERGLGESITEVGGSLLGIWAPLKGLGVLEKGLKAYTRLGKIEETLRKGNLVQRSMALAIEIGLEEAKFQAVGGQAGGGAGFAIHRNISPRLPKLKGIASLFNPLFQMGSSSISMTSAMQMAKVTEAGYNTLIGHEGFIDELSKMWGDNPKQELVSELIVNSFMGLAHGNVKPKRINEFRETAKVLRENGQIEEAKEFEAYADKADIIVKNRLEEKRQDGQRVESMQKSAGTMRELATKVRKQKKALYPNGQLNGRILAIPYEHKMYEYGSEVLAKSLETGATVVEAVEKAILSIRDTKWYKESDPEVQSQINKEIRGLLENKVRDLEAETFENAGKVSLKEFKEEGDLLAAELGANFKGERVKSSKRLKEKATEQEKRVSDVEDIVSGNLVVNSFESIPEAIKKLRSEGYEVKVNKTPDKDSGMMGARAFKTSGGMNFEIQIHTKETLKAHENMSKLTASEANKVDIGEPVRTIAPNESKVVNSSRPLDVHTIKNKAGEEVGEVFVNKGEKVWQVRWINITKGQGTGYGWRTWAELRDAARRNGAELVSDTTLLPGAVKVWEGMVKRGEAVKIGDSYIFKGADPKVIQEMKALRTGDIINKLDSPVIEAMKDPTVKGEFNDLIAKVNEGLSYRDFADTASNELKEFAKSKFPNKNNPLKELYNGAIGATEVAVNMKKFGITEKNYNSALDSAVKENVSKEYKDKVEAYREVLSEVFKGSEGREVDYNDIKPPEIGKVEDLSKGVREEYQKAYEGFGDIKVPGRPPKKAVQKEIDKELGITREKVKVAVDEYTGLKDQIKAEMNTARDIKDNAKAVRDIFNEFISSKKGIAGLNAKLSTAVMRKINNIDFTKPKTIQEAMDYVDKVLSDAQFRQDLIASDKAYNQIIEMVDEKSLTKKENDIKKAKVKGVADKLDRIRAIRETMFTGDYAKAQERITEILEKYEGSNITEMSLADYLEIERLNFEGLLSPTANPSLRELQARVRDLKDIKSDLVKTAAGRAMVRRGGYSEVDTKFKDIVAKGSRTKIETDPELRQSAVDNESFISTWSKKLDMVKNDSWHIVLDKMSRGEEGVKPGKGYLVEQFGKPIDRAEHNEYIGKQEQLIKVQNSFREIFGIESKSDVVGKVRENSKRDKVWYTKEKDGKTTKYEWSNNEIYKKWMELQDTSLAESHRNQGYLDKDYNPTDKYEALEKAMTPELRKWAEWQFDYYREYYDSINEVYRKIYGTDMPFNEKYSPIYVDTKGKIMEEGEVDAMLGKSDFFTAVSNGRLKSRIKHGKDLRPVNGDIALVQYINKMEAFRHRAEVVQDLNRTFKNGEIRDMIGQAFGKDYLEVIDNFINQFAGKNDSKMWEGTNALMNYYRKNFTIASLALKPNIFIKQLTSIPAYADSIPIKDFAVGVGDYFTHILEANRTLSSTDYIKQRYGEGWDRDVAFAIQKDAAHVLAGGKSWKDVAMFMTKWGDRGAIMVGGWSVYKHHYDKAIKNGLPIKEAKRIAEEEFVQATRNSQQSGSMQDLSYYQTAEPWMKLLTMYKTAPLQYHRKVAGAVRNLAWGRGSKSENIKTLMIYHAVLPQIFTMASNGFKWDGGDQLQSLLIGNFNALFLFGDLIEHFANKIQDKPFNYQVTPALSTVGEADKLIADFKKLNDEITFDEVMAAMKHAGFIVGDLTGQPVKGVANSVDGIVDAVTDNTKYPMRRILGWSENSLQNGMELTDLPEHILEKLSKDTDDNKKSMSDMLIEAEEIQAKDAIISEEIIAK